MTKILTIALVFCSYFCAGNPADPIQPGRLVEKVPCRSDPTQTYALYIPAKGNKNPLPIIYFFDPHGDGALPLKKYKALADGYGFILAGSNNSKNGNDWLSSENIWRHLSDDTKARLKINSNRIYTCGFSGGARMAGYVALQHPGIKGVIANGAGLPDGTPAGDFTFSFTAVGGEGDMNLTELISITSELDRTRTRHRIIIFDGRHEWAPENTMSNALAGWQFDAMRDGLIPKDNAFIDRYVAKSKARLNTLYNTGQLIKAGQECNLSISQLERLTPETAWFKQQVTSLTNDPRYKQQRQTEEALLIKENNTKTEYMQHFQQADARYWTGAINDLQAKVSAKTGESAMYQRLLSYLSLAFFSFSNHLINSNDNEGARHFVELYKQADPTNSEAWYFSAILDVRAHNMQAAKKDLSTAVKNGFRDKDRVANQPEFKQLDLTGIFDIH